MVRPRLVACVAVSGNLKPKHPCTVVRIADCGIQGVFLGRSRLMLRRGRRRRRVGRRARIGRLRIAGFCYFGVDPTLRPRRQCNHRALPGKGRECDGTLSHPTSAPAREVIPEQRRRQDDHDGNRDESEVFQAGFWERSVPFGP